MRDMPKEKMYEGVKLLVEKAEANAHFHLAQQKLFTLFSIGFQYLLFKSTKSPGAYIVRIEDSSLAEKLAKRSKDPSTRRFIQQMLLPRKMKYGRSTFFLDFFHIGSWNMTSELPKEKVKGAIIIKNTNSRPMMEIDEDEDGEDPYGLSSLPKDYYLTSLRDIASTTVSIAYGESLEGYTSIEFDFIPKEESSLKGVRIAKNLDLDFEEK